MSRFPEVLAGAVAVLMLAALPVHAAGNAERGATVFKKCTACHMVGDKAQNRVGPELNGIIGRKAGSVGGYKYSNAMRKLGETGATWSAEAIDAFITHPRKYLKGTKMTFAGLRKEEDRADVIAYLHRFTAGAAPEAPKPAATAPSPAPEQRPLAKDTTLPSHGVFHLGRVATPAEVHAWDIDVRPDGTGLPEGKGSVSQGEQIFGERCAVCHGDFGEGKDRWPVLAGGMDTLKADRPVKTIGSYWPFLSTVFDYIRRAMPFGDARSLTDDQVYALTAYLLYLNDIVTDTDFVLSKENFTTIHLPNEANFIGDTRHAESHYEKKGEPCMTNCKPSPAKIIMRARVLDVTPDNEGEGSQIE